LLSTGGKNLPLIGKKETMTGNSAKRGKITISPKNRAGRDQKN